jgi:bacillithiol biosynthesis deacetylase BshB1
MTKLDILAFGAHPDDTELGCSGTLAKLIQQGKKVGVVDLTQGEMGTRGTSEQRLREAENAAEILGLHERVNIGLPDTQLTNTRQHQIKIIEQVRRFQPDVCILTSPHDRHPDHGHATKLIQDALFYSGLRMLETTFEGESQEPWRPTHQLHYMQDTPFQPDIVFDISDVMEIKKKAILAFSSQFNVAPDSDEPQTYISGNNFFEALEARARTMGQRIGVTYGEAFQYGHDVIPMSDFDLFFKEKPKR